MNRNQTILIQSLPLGYNLVKIPGINPSYEVWQGTGSIRDFVHRFEDTTDAVQFLITSGYCNSIIEATRLLDRGGEDA